jgi:hypothetical protein
MIVKQKNQKLKFDILTYHFRQFNLSATYATLEIILNFGLIIRIQFLPIIYIMFIIKNKFKGSILISAPLNTYILL